MNYATWLYRRLSVMGPKEILFRVERRVQEVFEEKRYDKGWVPKTNYTIKTSNALFPPLDEYKDAWQSHYELDEEHLEKLLKGEINLFGHYDLNCGLNPQWNTEPVTGKQLPTGYAKRLNYRDAEQFGNVKAIWELGRLHHLVPLAVAYAISGDEKYLKPIVAHTESWMTQNPFLTGVHWCFSLEASLRLIAWSIIHSLIISRRGGDGLFDIVNDRQAFADCLYQHAWFVANFLSRYSSANNHIIGELTGLWIACKVFDLGEDGKKWATQCKQELEDEFRKQNFLDGVNKEQATYYHLWVLEYGLVLKLIGERCQDSFSKEFNEIIAKMANFLRAVIPPNGEAPQIGDADDGFVTRFDAQWPERIYEDVLDAEAYARGSKDFSMLPQKAFWYGLIGGIKENKSSLSKDLLARALTYYPQYFELGGYAVLGDERLHVVFDAGSLGYPEIAAHAHSDMLSFCLALDGEWLIVDPGTYCYHDKIEWRDYFRSAAAHNTVTVNNSDQSVIGGPFLWLKHANATMEVPNHKAGHTLQQVAGFHDGYTDIGVNHKRTISYNAESKKLYIEDELTGDLTQPVEINFHFHPSVQLQEDQQTNQWLLSKSGNILLTLRCDSQEWSFSTYSGSEKPKRGWYSDALGKKQPALCLTGIYQGNKTVKKISLQTILTLRVT